MSKESDERTTPDELFVPLNKEFNFTLDVCATKLNAKCEKYFTIEQDALHQKWRPNICFL